MRVESKSEECCKCNIYNNKFNHQLECVFLPTERLNVSLIYTSIISSRLSRLSIPQLSLHAYHNKGAGNFLLNS